MDPFPDITVEEAEARMRSRPSLLATLTAEQIAFFRSYDGPENVGPAGPKRKVS